jgi:AAA domain-containing protein
MCTSGARLQLAIAPAGAGKTTAMRTLARSWSDSGGQVLGLAPSAAAAAQLRDATGAPADTLAKLTWSIRYGELPDWAERIGRSSLVIIDEAGMADTLSLDTAVQFIICRGGSIRLVGDDQQLAAVGAGGVLRDIQASYGAVRLTELHRFTDPAEAAAPSPSATANAKHSASTWTGDASTSATPPPPSTPSSTPGRPTAATVSMRSCWLPPGSWSAGSTNAPGTTALPAPLRARRSSWATATGPASAT